MKNTLLIALLLISSQFGFSQLNMSLLSNVNYQTLHNAQLNDIWGYVDEEGNEYALVGTTKGSSIVDVTDPQNPVEVFWLPGTDNIWRDLVTWGDYAYISTEAQDGILIIDLSPLPHSTNLPYVFTNGNGPLPVNRAHTIFATDGYCYIFGSNVGNGGVQIWDLQTNPMEPTYVSSFDNWYVHDGFVQNDTMYLGHIYDGFFSIVDVTNKTNPTLLGTKTTPSLFTHNVWPSPDGNFAYTTDEVSGAFIGAYDISDPTDIKEVDRIQSSPGKNVVPHNTHFINDYIVTSYYSDGVTIHDVTHPYNMIEVGNFDTYPYQTSGFDGCWGAYPYLPSGNILATDREYGLFVLGANYQKAAYLEGTVTDITNGNPIDNVTISIANWEHVNHSDIVGFYATGRPTGGIASVTYNKIGYYPETDNVMLQNGVITTHNVQLIPIPPYNLTVTVIDEETGNEIQNASIRIENEHLSHDGLTNGIGEEDMTLYYEGLYTVTVGRWGHITYCFDTILNQSSSDFTVSLKKGYHDDFSFDYGWFASGTALSGLWVRDIPFGTQENANPDRDAPYDCGKYAYVTGNTHNFDFTVDEVASGWVRLFSPVMDLTTYTDPHVNYFKWFYTRYGNTPAIDSLSIYLMNGSQTTQIDVMKVRDFMDYWEHASIRVLDFMPVTANMQILVETSDFDPDWNIVEAGFDHFFVSNYNTVSIENVSKEAVISIYPNPFSSTITIENANEGPYTITDLNGRLVQDGYVDSMHYEVETSSLQKGLYFITIGNSVVRVIKN